MLRVFIGEAAGSLGQKNTPSDAIDSMFCKNTTGMDVMRYNLFMRHVLSGVTRSVRFFRGGGFYDEIRLENRQPDIPCKSLLEKFTNLKRYAISTS